MRVPALPQPFLNGRGDALPYVALAAIYWVSPGAKGQAAGSGDGGARSFEIGNGMGRRRSGVTVDGPNVST
jgi:hypothetical protein